MSTSPSTPGLSLEVLAGEIAILRAESAAQREEIAELRDRARGPMDRTSKEGPGSRSAAPSEGHPAKSVNDTDRPVSRRGALKSLGAVAAGGAGLAIGSAFLGAEPAAATTGAMQYGTSNNAGSDATVLTANTPAGHVTFFAQNTSGSGFGLYGVAVAESGIDATEGSAVVGDTNGNGPGVQGLCGAASGVGVHGIAGGRVLSEADIGFCGVAGEATAALGSGVRGIANNGFGVIGETFADTLAGVQGNDDSTNGGYGVYGISLAGIGGFFSGGHAPFQLGKGLGTGPPTNTGHLPGEFYVDSTGALFYCYAANEWVQLNKGFTNLLPTPIRVFDSRLSGNPADKSRPAGPVAAQSVTTLQITGTSVGGEAVPAGVVAVVGNATVVNPSGGGWLTLYPAGKSTPLASNLNFQSGDVARANFCIVGLSSAGAIDVFAQVKTDFLFDVTGYVL